MTKKTQESVEKFAFGYHSALNNLFINSNHTILVSIGNLKSLYDGVNQLSLFDLSAFTIQQNSIWNTPNTLGRKLGTKLANHYVAIPMVQPQSETFFFFFFFEI